MIHENNNSLCTFKKERMREREKDSEIQHRLLMLNKVTAFVRKIEAFDCAKVQQMS